MLPAGSRLHTSSEFAAVVRSGRRAGSRHLVVHLLHGAGSGAPRVGFVVSTKVGNAVVRHRVTRRLRPLMRSELSRLPAGTEVVVRALPSAAGAASADLAADLRSALAAAERKSRTAPAASGGRS